MEMTFVVVDVLLIEQDAKERRAISDMMSVGGFQVTTASSAQEIAKLELERRKFDLAIIDRMPDAVKSALIKALQGRRLVIKKGAIVLDEIAGLEAHFKLTHLLRKPFTPQKLSLVANMIAPRT